MTPTFVFFLASGNMSNLESSHGCCSEVSHACHIGIGRKESLLRIDENSDLLSLRQKEFFGVWAKFKTKSLFSLIQIRRVLSILLDLKIDNLLRVGKFTNLGQTCVAPDYMSSDQKKMEKLFLNAACEGRSRIVWREAARDSRFSENWIQQWMRRFLVKFCQFCHYTV